MVDAVEKIQNCSSFAIVLGYEDHNDHDELRPIRDGGVGWQAGGAAGGLRQSPASLLEPGALPPDAWQF